MIVKFTKPTAITICLKAICIALTISCSGCLDWMMGGSGDDYIHDVLVENSTSDTILLYIYIDSTEIKTDYIPIHDYELAPDSIATIDGNGLEDFNYDPVKEYLKDARNREAYVIRKNGETVKIWLKDRDKTGHSPYNPASWEVNKTEDVDVRGWIKFSIEEDDLVQE